MCKIYVGFISCSTYILIFVRGCKIHEGRNGKGRFNGESNVNDMILFDFHPLVMAILLLSQYLRKFDCNYNFGWLLNTVL